MRASTRTQGRNSGPRLEMTSRKSTLSPTPASEAEKDRRKEKPR